MSQTYWLLRDDKRILVIHKIRDSAVACFDSLVKKPAVWEGFIEMIKCVTNAYGVVRSEEREMFKMRDLEGVYTCTIEELLSQLETDKSFILPPPLKLEESTAWDPPAEANERLANEIRELLNDVSGESIQ